MVNFTFIYSVSLSGTWCCPDPGNFAWRMFTNKCQLVAFSLTEPFPCFSKVPGWNFPGFVFIQGTEAAPEFSHSGNGSLALQWGFSLRILKTGHFEINMEVIKPFKG